MIEALGLLEHILAEHALVQAGGGDRRNMVDMPGLNQSRKLDQLACTRNVGLHLRVCIGPQVIDCGQMVDMIDLTFQAADAIVADTEIGGNQIAKNRQRTCLANAPESQQLG